ncbi:MAG: EcsC family protein [Chroococcidiopsidaceae cyanobacterium CP_BM_RX_35]|nr:EcsC family protein [Chroococcidiopsidaceae cyanobacterium CP_BM_RX_35]
MTTQGTEKSSIESVTETIATVIRVGGLASELAITALQSAADNVTSTTTAVGETVGPVALQLVEQGTETLGQIVTPIAENPIVQYAAKVPGISWLLTALGHVDVEQARKDVEQLQQEYVLETPEQLAHRVIFDACLKAGGVGLITNFLPPFALTLFALDLAAMTTLQAEMLYRIAAVYGFSLKDPARRGEVLAIFGLSVGGSGVLKVGLGIVELIPGMGAVIGASSNAALLYSLGYTACRFYEAKRNFA